MKYFVSLFFLVLFIACGDDNKIEPPVEESDITLSVDEISFEGKGGGELVIVKAESAWRVLELPDWISVDQTRGIGDTDIVIEVTANRKETPRNATIVFATEKFRAELNVIQHKGAIDIDITWKKLNLTLHYELENMVLGDDQKTRIYTFSSDRMFINPSKTHGISSKAFLGNIFANQLPSCTDMKVYDGYSFDSITVSSNTLDLSRVFVPSLANQKSYADEIISNKPTQSESFVADQTGIPYHSHRELNLIGMSNIGEKLDELIAGSSYQTTEMKKKTGLIYSYRHAKFSLHMDYPDSPVPEEYRPKDLHSYIYSITYGRVGLLIVESDFDKDRVRSVIKKVLKGGNLSISDDDNAILEEFNAYHLHFDSFGILRVKKGKLDAVQSYIKEITEDSSIIYPISFDMGGLIGYAIKSATFQVVLP